MNFSEYNRSKEEFLMKNVKGTVLRNMTSIYIERDGRLLMLYRIGSRVVDLLGVVSAGTLNRRN